MEKTGLISLLISVKNKTLYLKAFSRYILNVLVVHSVRIDAVQFFLSSHIFLLYRITILIYPKDISYSETFKIYCCLVFV